jgi:hypothetical protein
MTLVIVESMTNIVEDMTNIVEHMIGAGAGILVTIITDTGTTTGT